MPAFKVKPSCNDISGFSIKAKVIVNCLIKNPLQKIAEDLQKIIVFLMG